MHRSERICPVSGPGLLSQSERERRAREIISASGADSEAYFRRVAKQVIGVTFREQAKWWLHRVQTRKRNPVASSTVETWQCCLTNWLNPNIGDLPLSEVNNGALKTVVAAMADGGLSPKSISNYAQVVKMVVASAVDEQGEEIHPRRWNHEFVDMPVVEKEKQNTPCFPSEIMTGLASWEKRRERMLFILCGAGGFRIGEALGVEIDKHISPDFLTISVTQKVRRGKVEHRLKTPNGKRGIDLHSAIAALLKEFVGDRRSGFCSAHARQGPFHSRTSSAAIYTRLSRSSATSIHSPERTRRVIMHSAASATRTFGITRHARMASSSSGWVTGIKTSQTATTKSERMRRFGETSPNVVVSGSNCPELYRMYLIAPKNPKWKMQYKSFSIGELR